MNEMPESWITAPLSVISSEVPQRVPEQTETFTYIDIGSVDRDTKTITAPQVLLGKDAPSRARKQVATGDTLVSMTRPNLNAVALVPPSLDGQIASTGFDVLRPLAGIDPRWLAYIVRTEHFVSAMSEMVQGSLYPAVRAKDVRAYVAPVAPSAEQTRIADQLDTLLSRINACKYRLDTIPSLLKRFRLAVLAAATTGLLTEDCRKSQSITSAAATPMGWIKSSIRAVTTDLRYGTSKKCGYSTDGVGVLRIPNIADHGQIDVRDLKSAQFDDKEIEKLALAAGDLLVIRSNGSVDLVGKTSIVTSKEAGLLFAGYLMRLRVNPDLAMPEFVRLCLAAPMQRKYIEHTAKSTSGVNNLNAEELRALPLLLPKPSEQAEIVRRVKALFKLADRIEIRYNAACLHTQRLTPLVLAKAFRGDLVPQDPNDDPASEFLAKSKNAQSQQSTKRKLRVASRSIAPIELANIGVISSKVSTSSVIKIPSGVGVTIVTNSGWEEVSELIPDELQNLPDVYSKRIKSKGSIMNKSRLDKDVKGQPYLANHLRRMGEPMSVQVLFKASELPVADFYKQLAWEVAQGLVKDNTTTLETGHAAG